MTNEKKLVHGSEGIVRCPILYESENEAILCVIADLITCCM